MQPGAAWGPVARAVGQTYRSVCAELRAPILAHRLDELEAAAPPGSVPVGYSMGGRLALHAALRTPGRFAALVLVGVSAGLEDDAARTARRAADERLAAWMERHTIEAVVERWEANPVFATQPPEVVGAQRPGRLAHDPRALAALLRSAGQGALPPVWHRLGTLDLPVLLLAGELDPAYAAAARRMAALLPRGVATVVPGAGHAPQLERPAAVAFALRQFLDEHLGERAGVGGHAEPRPLGHGEEPEGGGRQGPGQRGIEQLEGGQPASH